MATTELPQIYIIYVGLLLTSVVDEQLSFSSVDYHPVWMILNENEE
jgi:hypothetical protein